MAENQFYVTRDNTKLTPEDITIAGSVTRQQHKLSQCVVAKVSAEFSTVEGFSSWKNIQDTFEKYTTESTVEAGLKAHDFILERIIPGPLGKPIMEFRVSSQEQLYRLSEGIEKKFLADLILDYMIPKEKRSDTDVLVLLSFHKSQYDELEEKLKEIQRKSEENYVVYKNSRRMVNEDEILQKRSEKTGKENALRIKNMAGRHESRPKSVLRNVENVQ